MCWSGRNNELHLLGGFSDGMTLVRPLTTQRCGYACGMLMTLGPQGRHPFCQPRSLGQVAGVIRFRSRGRWTLGPDGELYLLRQTTAFATELIVIAVDPPATKRLTPVVGLPHAGRFWHSGR